MGRGALVVGSLLIIIGGILFVFDFINLNSYILYFLSSLAFITSILAGRKIAFYMHDLHLSRKRGMKLGMPMMIYFWLFFFILLLITYTIFKIALGYFVKAFLVAFGGKYFAIVYNTLTVIGGYLLFSGLASKKDYFLTIWGKTANKMENLPREMLKKGKEEMEGMKDMGMGMMKKFRP